MSRRPRVRKGQSDEESRPDPPVDSIALSPFVYQTLGRDFDASDPPSVVINVRDAENIRSDENTVTYPSGYLLFQATLGTKKHAWTTPSDAVLRMHDDTYDKEKETFFMLDVKHPVERQHHVSGSASVRNPQYVLRFPKGKKTLPDMLAGIVEDGAVRYLYKDVATILPVPVNKSKPRNVSISYTTEDASSRPHKIRPTEYDELETNPAEWIDENPLDNVDRIFVSRDVFRRCASFWARLNTEGTPGGIKDHIMHHVSINGMGRPRGVRSAPGFVVAPGDVYPQYLLSLNMMEHLRHRVHRRDAQDAEKKRAFDAYDTAMLPMAPELFVYHRNLVTFAALATKNGFLPHGSYVEPRAWPSFKIGRNDADLSHATATFSVTIPGPPSAWLKEGTVDTRKKASNCTIHGFTSTRAARYWKHKGERDIDKDIDIVLESQQKKTAWALYIEACHAISAHATASTRVKFERYHSVSSKENAGVEDIFKTPDPDALATVKRAVDGMTANKWYTFMPSALKKSFTRVYKNCIPLHEELGMPDANDIPVPPSPMDTTEPLGRGEPLESLSRALGDAKLY